jgi:preprotein translocase subunit SecG
MTVIHLIVCIVLILAVLLQSGKGGGLSSAMGGGGGGGAMGGQMFGGRGAATFLSKMTTVLAALYMLLVISLNLLPNDTGPQSIIQEEALRNQQASPAQGLPDATNPRAVPATRPQGLPEGAEGAVSTPPE